MSSRKTRSYFEVWWGGIKTLPETTSIHGFRFIADSKKHWTERVFWSIFVLLSWYGSAQLIQAQYDAFENNPISFVVETAYKDWDTHFPSVAVCESDNIKRIEEVSDELWGSEHDFNIEEVLKELAYFKGITYYTSQFCGSQDPLQECFRNNISYYANLVRSSCPDTIANCSWNGNSFDCCKYFQPLETELGPCYAINSIQGREKNAPKLPMISNRVTGPGNIQFNVLVAGNVYVLNEEEVPTLTTLGTDVLAVSPELFHRLKTMNKRKKTESSLADYKRRKYAEVKADPEAYEAAKEKERARYHRKKEDGKVHSIKDLSARDQRAKRKKWKEAAKKYRQKKKELQKEVKLPEAVFLIENENQEIEATSSQRQKSTDPISIHRKYEIKFRKLRYIELQKRKELMKVIDNLKKENNQLKKKLQKEKTKNSSKAIGEVQEKSTLKTQKHKSIRQSELIELIQAFYNQDDNSTVVAGKKQYITRRKIRKQRRTLNYFLNELHKKFIMQSGFRVSYSFFCRQRPFWVTFPKKDQRETCACIIHSNMDLTVECLNRAGIIVEKDSAQLLKTLCCSPYNETCLKRECETCKDKVLAYKEFQNEKTLPFFQWTRIVEKVNTKKGPKTQNVTIKKENNSSPLEVIHELEKQLPKFFKHSFIIQTQYSNTKSKKESLRLNEAYIHVDFSENFGLKYATEVQSIHFGPSRKEICLHTGVIYTFDFQFNETGTTCACTVSECLRHDAPAIWAHMVPMIQLAMEKNPLIDTIHIQSDSPTSQYRNKYIFYMISVLSKDFPQIKEITWNYSESGHGKGAPDGVGAVLKRTADTLVKFGQDVSTFNTFLDLMQENVENVDIMTVDEKDVIDKEKKIPKTLKPFKGTLEAHQVLWSKEVTRLTLRKTSCFSCSAGTVCIHKTHLGFIPIVPDTIIDKNLKAKNSPAVAKTKGRQKSNKTTVTQNKDTPGPSNIIILSDKKIVFKKRLISIRNIENDAGARIIAPEKRKCRYTDENNLDVYRHYSYSACTVQCRKDAQLERCNCTNFFMPNVPERLKCDAIGVMCLNDHLNELSVLKAKWASRPGLHCDCLPSCTEAEISIVNDFKITSAEPYAGVQIDLATLPSERYRRNVIRGILDLVVSTGGTAGLFLGASILSFVELLYILLVRPFCNIYSHRKDDPWYNKFGTRKLEDNKFVPNPNWSYKAH